MSRIQIGTDPTALYQRQTINLDFGETSKRVVFELRYLYRTEKWYISMFDAQTGNPLCTYVPVIASHAVILNLLEPYIHKNIGWIVCIPTVDEPSSENPGMDNLNEFALIWGDEFE